MRQVAAQHLRFRKGLFGNNDEESISEQFLNE